MHRFKRFLSAQWYWWPSVVLLMMAVALHLAFCPLWETHTDWLDPILVAGAVFGFLIARLVDKGFRQ